MKKLIIIAFVILSSLLQATSSHHQVKYCPVQTLVSDPSISPPIAEDSFGIPYVTDDYIFVGDPHAFVGGQTLTGAAYVFKREGKHHWTNTQYLSEGGFFNHESGTQVKSYGKWLFVSLFGTPISGTDISTLDLKGALVIYRRDDLGVWQLHQVLDSTTVPELANLTALDPASLSADTAYTNENGAFFGTRFDVDTKHNLLLVGAHYQAQCCNINAGAVYAFRLAKNKQWKYAQTINSPIGDFTNETFGGNITIRNKIALISNSTDVVADPRVFQATNSGNGSVYLYRYHKGKWRYLERVQGDQTVGTPFAFADSSTWDVSDNFGGTLAMNDKWALIGASFETMSPGVAPFAGALYIYEVKKKEGKPHLVFKQKFFSDDPTSQGFTLGTLALKENIAYAADSLRTGPVGIYQGGVNTYQFKKGSWVQTQTVYDPEGTSFAFFGSFFSLNKKHLAIGQTPEIGEVFQELGDPQVPTFTPVPGKVVIYKIKR